jgi:16S rRNA (cytidine1402-2'-O)-methyltransferase
MEKEIRERKRVQVFIEAPYRNQKLLETLLEKLSASVMLSVVCDVTLPTEEVIVMPISQWKKREVASFNKRPAVFLLGTS